MFPENDNQFEECSLNQVEDHGDGYTFSTESGCIAVDKAGDFEPKVGMKVRFYGKGFGFPVRGIFVNGHKFYYRTEAEEEQRHQNWVRDSNNKKKAEFEANKKETDRRVAALPEVYQRRLNKFRTANPDFRWNYEPYELFCCEQSLVLADALKTPEALLEWNKKEYKEQMAAVPGLSDEHSGNTQGASVRLAYHYLTNQENVYLEHGALVQLVGCKAYGCPHKEDEK